MKRLNFLYFFFHVCRYTHTCCRGARITSSNTRVHKCTLAIVRDYHHNSTKTPDKLWYITYLDVFHTFCCSNFFFEVHTHTHTYMYVYRCIFAQFVVWREKYWKTLSFVMFLLWLCGSKGKFMYCIRQVDIVRRWSFSVLRKVIFK